MAREEFIRNVWRAARHFGLPQDESGDAGDAAAAELLYYADLWLAPASVEDFSPDDFLDLSQERREALTAHVRRFGEIVGGIKHVGPAADEQTRMARREMGGIISIVGGLILRQWKKDLAELSEKVTGWSRRRHWEVRQEAKRLSESLLGAYEAPRLLIHTPDGRVLLDPVTRFAVGADGLVELCVMPSYDSAKFIRVHDQWYLQPAKPRGRRQELVESVFIKALESLFQSV